MRPQLQRARPRNTGRLSRLPDSGRRAPRRRLLPGSSSGSGERLREEHGRGNIVRRVERHERHRHAAREHIARRKRVDPDVEFGVLVAGVDVAGDADGPTHRDDACEPASELRMCVQQLGRVHQRCEREERHVLRLRDDVGEQPRPRFRAAGARPSEARARRGRPPCPPLDGELVRAGQRFGSPTRNRDVRAPSDCEQLGRRHYRVRWEDGRVSLYYPAGDATVRHTANRTRS